MTPEQEDETKYSLEWTVERKGGQLRLAVLPSRHNTLFI